MAKPYWKQIRRSYINRQNRAKADFTHEQYVEWGRMGGGMPWQIKYGAPEERAAWRAQRKQERGNGRA